MGKQSARIFFQGKDHKEIYFDGKYHNAMYQGNKLIWKKLKSAGWEKFETEMYGVCCGNGVILTADYDHIYTSTDGIIWTQGASITMSLPAIKASEAKIIYLNGFFYIFRTVEFIVGFFISKGTYVYRTYDGKTIEKLKVNNERKDTTPHNIIPFKAFVISENQEVFAIDKEDYGAEVWRSEDCINWKTINIKEYQLGSSLRKPLTFLPKNAYHTSNLKHENGYWYFFGKVYDHSIKEGNIEVTTRTGRFWKTKSFQEFEEALFKGTKIDDTNWKRANWYAFKSECLSSEDAKWNYNIFGDEWEEAHNIFGISASELNGIEIIESSLAAGIENKIFSITGKVQRNVIANFAGLIVCKEGTKKVEFFKTTEGCGTILKLNNTYYAYSRSWIFNKNIVYIRKE